LRWLRHAESSYCFQRVLAIAILSVRLSVTRVDQSKAVQARMTLNAKIGGFMDILAISGCDTNLYHSLGGATERYAIQIENLVFVY